MKGSHGNMAWKGTGVSAAPRAPAHILSASSLTPAVFVTGRSLQASTYFTPMLPHLNYALLVFPFYSGISLLFQKLATVHSLGMKHFRKYKAG